MYDRPGSGRLPRNGPLANTDEAAKGYTHTTPLSRGVPPVPSGSRYPLSVFGIDKSRSGCGGGRVSHTHTQAGPGDKSCMYVITAAVAHNPAGIKRTRIRNIPIIILSAFVIA